MEEKGRNRREEEETGTERGGTEGKGQAQGGGGRNAHLTTRKKKSG